MANDCFRQRSRAQRILATVALLLAATVAGAPDRRALDPIVKGSVFVKYRAGQAGRVQAAAASGPPAVTLSTGGAASTIPLRTGESVQDGVDRLAQMEGVEYVLPNVWVHATAGPPAFQLPSDPLMASSWGMEKISAGYAWGIPVRGRMDTAVCIIDSGVDCEHPDLKPFCKDGASFIGGIGSYGLEAARDEAGHGTYIAGVVAAAGDGRGTAGVMYGGVALYVCKFMDAQGYGTTADAFLCLDWCLHKGTAVSINAWGASIDYSAEDLSRIKDSAPSGSITAYTTAAAAFQALGEALKGAYGGHLFVAAAGNQAQRLRLPQAPGDCAFLPAQLRLENMLVVGATDASDALWMSTATASAGSNSGSAWVNIAAPGALIWTTRMRTPEEKALAPGLPTYAEVSGTSLSTAFVGGVAGLILAASGNKAALEMGDVRDAILGGADVVPRLLVRGSDNQTLVAEGRRLNAYNALAYYFYWPQLPAELCGRGWVFGGGSTGTTAPPPSPRPPPPRPPNPSPAIQRPPPPSPQRRPPPPQRLPPSPMPPAPLLRPPPPRPPPPSPPPRRPPPPPPRPITCAAGTFLLRTSCVSCKTQYGASCATCTDKLCVVKCTNVITALCPILKKAGR